MKTQLLLALSCLLFLLPSVIAQEDDVKKPDDNVERRLNEIMVSCITRAVFEEDPSGIFMLALAVPIESILPGFKEEFGITDEQREHLVEVMRSQKLENSDEVLGKFNAIQQKIVDDINYELTDEEDDLLTSVLRYTFEAANVSAAEALTGGQIQKMDGMMLALTGGLESPLFNERHMDAIEMTDEQKKQFKKIDEETKPGREKLIAAISAETLKMMDTGKMDFKGLLGTFSTFREYSTDLKRRRTAVLTDVQLAKMRQVSRLPKFLSIFNVMPQWTPSADSWKPGDPIPEQYRQERKTRRGFPREE